MLDEMEAVGVMAGDCVPKTILYVEPEKDVRDRTLELLNEIEGVPIHATDSSSEGIAKLSERSFDFIIAGCGLLPKEREKLLNVSKSNLPESVFIAIVKPGNEREAIACLMDGASCCVIYDEKFPLSLKDALHKVSETLSLKKARAALETERAELLSILNSLDVPAYVSDPNTYEVLFANRIVTRDFGEVVGRKCYEAFQGLDAPCPFCTNKYILGENLGGTYIWEFQNLNTHKWYRCIDKAIHWPDGRMVRSEIAIDITDIKKAQEKMSFQAGLLDACGEAIIATDLDGHITYWNRYAEFLFGLPSEEVIGSDIFILPAADLREKKKEILETVALTESWSGEMKVRRSDGSTFFSFTRISPIQTESIETIGTVWIVQAISERKRTEQALRNIINETNARREEISALLESSRYILEQKDFEEAAKTVFEICKRLLKASSGFVSLKGEEKISMVFSSAGDGRAVGDPSFMDLVGVLFEKVCETGKTILINNISSNEYAIEKRLPLRATNLILSRLTENGNVVGALCLADKEGGFSKRDVLIVEAFCEILSLAYRSSHTMQLLSISEAKHRQLIEKIPDIIYQISSEGVITDLNPAFESITGWRINDWVGKPWEGIVHPEDLEEVTIAFRSAIAGWEYPRFEARILKPSGEYITCEFTVTPYYEQDRIVGILGVARDVTERVARERETIQTRELYRNFLELSPDAVFITDRECRIIEASKQAARILRSGSMEDLRGMNVYDFAVPGERWLMENSISNPGGTESSDVVEIALQRCDGFIFYGELRTSTLTNEEGGTRGYIIDLRDITERRAQQEEIQRINLELEGYAHAVSHDLRSPLANVIAGCEALEIILKKYEGVLEDEEIRGLVNVIKGNAEKCDLLIGDLLLLAESGQRTENVTEVDIDEVIGEILEEEEKKIQETKTTVKVGAPLGTVKANRTHMYQLFGNLIRNSIAHAQRTDLLIEISRIPTDIEGAHRFLVRDNGKGISEDILDKVFKPYVTSQNNSIGLGLAIVSKIIKAYSGTIKAYNDNGACFDLTIFDVR